MQINKFKKVGNGKYKIYFDNTNITLYEDVILKYELLLKKDLDVDLLDNIIEENKYYEAYNIALSYIEIKMRNQKEIISYLSKKGYEESYIEYTIDKLANQGLLNNINYIEAYINDKITLSSDGPNKIKNMLLELDFKESDIDNYLYSIDDEIWIGRVEKLINKKKSLMKSKSYYMFVNKIRTDLINLGYDKEMIDDKLSNIEYESNSLEKEFDKANRKFKGDKIKITNSLLRKGYSYDEINSYFRE